MANDLLNELNRNLANAEEIGNVEWAKALKKRIADLEKPAPAPKPAAVPAAAAKAPVRKTVKKAVKQTRKKK